MLKSGMIPREEPVIRVGIILPEDNQITLRIEIPDPTQYQIRAGFPLETPQVLSLEAHSNSIVIDGKTTDRIFITQSGDSTNLKKSLVLKPVTAGRGFHWKKQIDVSLLGNLEIGLLNESLLVINELPLEHYLMCVSTSEMSAACPPALIEAQTIVARSWLLAQTEWKHHHMGFDVCNDDCCQRYQGNKNLTRQSIQSMRATHGQVLMVDNTICDARYSKSCGGMAETFDTVWGGNPLSYFQNRLDMPGETGWDALPLSEEKNTQKWIRTRPSTFCSPDFVPEDILKNCLGSIDEEGHYFRWTFEYSQTELTHLLNSKLNLEAKHILTINPVNRGGSGRLTQIRIHYIDTNNLRQSRAIYSEHEIRRVLHPSFLYSSAIIIDHQDIQNEIPDQFIIHGAGWGHGVGLCQIGALGMALNGYDTKTILQHYYPGSRLIKIYD